MGLERYLLELYQFQMSLEDIIKNIVKNNEGKIVGMVKLRLYQTGRDGSGRQIKPDYTPNTKARKKEKGQRAAFVTLRDEGLWYAGFYIEMQKYTIILNSSDEKTSFLLDKYGEAILEFTKQEQEYIMDAIIEPELEKIISKLETNSSSAGGLDIDTF